MNNSKLNELLRRAAVPARTEAEWQELAGDTMRSVAASREGAAFTRDAAAQRSHRTPWLLGLGLGTACVLVGFFLGHWRSERQAQRAELADARKLFAEINMMFPDQLQAVVLDGAAPRLVLADEISWRSRPAALRAALRRARLPAGHHLQRPACVTERRELRGAARRARAHYRHRANALRGPAGRPRWRAATASRLQPWAGAL